MKQIKYKKLPKGGKYKYEATEEYVFYSHYSHPIEWAEIDLDFLLVNEDSLIFKPGYRWDGASGPTIDTEDTMTASAVHDAYYQLIREKIYPVSFKKIADLELRHIMYSEILPTDNVFIRILKNIRAEYYYQSVRIFGWYSL